MPNPFGGKRINYEQALRAIGHLAEEQRLRDVCVLEIEGGMVLQGDALVGTSQGYQLVPRTQEFSRKDLEDLARDL
jgi:hypothetical protein